MLKYEFFKVFSNKKNFIIIAICLILKIAFSMQMDIDMPEGFNAEVYRYYSEQLEGEYTKKKHDFIVSEYNRFQELLENEHEYVEKFENDKIDAKEYKVISDDIKSAKNRLKTVEYIVQKSEYYEKQDEQVEYFFDIYHIDYVSNMKVDIFLIIVMLVMITSIYTDDYYSGTVTMIRSSQNGRKKLFINRLICNISISAFFSLLLSIIEFMVKYFKFGMSHMDASIKSLLIMENMEYNLTIGQYVLATIALRCFFAVIVGLIIMFIAEKIHTNMGTYLIVLALIFLPEFIYESLGVVIRDLTLAQGLGVYRCFNNYHTVCGVPNIIFSILMYMIIGNVLLLIKFKKVNN